MGNRALMFDHETERKLVMAALCVPSVAIVCKRTLQVKACTHCRSQSVRVSDIVTTGRSLGLSSVYIYTYRAETPA
eukprot:scaffold391449_cov24-Prasinocladus_malaysianus.AAC.1